MTQQSSDNPGKQAMPKRKRLLTEADIHFYEGFATCLGTMARGVCNGSVADVMQTNGISLSDLEAAEISDFDMGPIREALK